MILAFFRKLYKSVFLIRDFIGNLFCCPFPKANLITVKHLRRCEFFLFFHPAKSDQNNFGISKGTKGENKNIRDRIDKMKCEMWVCLQIRNPYSNPLVLNPHVLMWIIFLFCDGSFLFFGLPRLICREFIS